MIEKKPLVLLVCAIVSWWSPLWKALKGSVSSGKTSLHFCLLPLLWQRGFIVLYIRFSAASLFGSSICLLSKNRLRYKATAALLSLSLDQ